MKAAVFEQTGAPEVIQYRDLPEPIPQASELRIRVGAVSLNPVDTYIRSGAISVPLQNPHITGCDFAGTVEEVGAEVTRFQVGDRVWGSNQTFFGRQGTFAEQICVDEAWCYPTPDGQTDESAAAGALVGLTAHLGLFLHGKLQPGDIAFVNGGTGGVGSAVVQFAKAHGAIVITTAGSEEKREHCRSIGADAAFDYRDEQLDSKIREFCEQTGKAGIGLWYETQREPTLERTIDLMAPRGRIIVMAGRDARPDFPLGRFYTRDLTLAGFAMFNGSPDEQRECADEMNRWFVEGEWQLQIGQIFPLSEAAEAHRFQEENTLGNKGTLSGKIVLTP
ncbi:quinone oxidoreductase family protein [Calycomorphotria hydatis]|uniref:Zinc-type alcohol dehydrogenase-like protein n=1 Tax=Calycomorphotria hydatis TaxID=2528027 RepID=A0A517T961_9PLAN|nr:NADPH:quinone reductase [Calycomorphotria hydatis]QDT64922.1 Zinc-type alcohol dehydrogenase-like protein [Calycomorphotria hydatis]